MLVRVTRFIMISTGKGFLTDSILTSLLMMGRHSRDALWTLMRLYEVGGLEVQRLDLYYFAAQLQHIAHWLDMTDNWEKLLLRRVAAECLPEFLIECAGPLPDVPHTVRHTAITWHRFVQTVLKQARPADDRQYVLSAVV
ncbi:hypothetical protein NDU88_004180 [Pleurodeles waltl]|uniref:Uncharacterized protein n=1 Tax=Pleurodeles waltl TaxID=8319 RepID=A0AAV7NLZ2_PLEWA|nr:hypothetical protein NDU88_004180 [Pleurodeles waltl]